MNPLLPPPPARPGFLLVAFALLLALGHAWLATEAQQEKSTTADELAHITGGYTFNHWDDYRLHPENGILPQRWQALPAVMAGAHSPDLSGAAWGKSDVWVMGYRYFYASGNNPAWLLCSARAMNSLFGAATALLVFFWSRRVWGTAGAVVSAVFCALCPTMLAHSGLATSDMCMTLFLLLAVAAYWRHLHSGKWLDLCVSAGVFGLAGVAKHTSVLLLPMALLMVAVRLCRPAPLQLGRHVATSLWGKLGLTGFSLGVHGVAVVFFLWAFFGFRYSAFNPALPPGTLADPWSILLAGDEIPTRVIALCRNWRLLPEGYLYGLAFVLKHSHARGAFLDGEYSIYGWVGFFPKTFLYKTPLSLLAGLVAGGVLCAVRCRTLAGARLAARLYQVVPLLVLFAVYWVFSLTSHLNIGHRHILPTYPVLYIFCGVLGWSAWAAAKRSRGAGAVTGILAAALLGWHALVAVKIHPDYLAYFSSVVGGPAEGYKHLVDSSLDWGQDLPALKKWLNRNQHAGEKTYLAYFGSAEPEYYGIDAVRLPTLPDFERPHPWYWCEPGVYAISATMLQHVYMPRRGDWTAASEKQYQGLRLNDASFRLLKASPEGHPELLRDITREEWSKAWTLYEQLRFARLCHYLRARRADGMAGYSILIYRLSAEELAAALDGDMRTLGAAIERALAGNKAP